MAGISECRVPKSAHLVSIWSISGPSKWLLLVTPPPNAASQAWIKLTSIINSRPSSILLSLTMPLALKARLLYLPSSGRFQAPLVAAGATSQKFQKSAVIDFAIFPLYHNYESML